MIAQDESSCPICGGGLKYYDTVPRIVRSKRRVTRWERIQRFQCPNCGSVHREIPEHISPYKQYEKEIIHGVIEGIITPETIGFEDYPCEMTMLRWKTQKSQIL